MTSELHILHRKYRRPKTLSDTFHDNTPAGLRELVAKPDERLGWGDFKDLLGPHLPAGTYDEVVYFLPLAFDHVRAKNWDALDLCSSLAWFCSEYGRPSRFGQRGRSKPGRSLARCCGNGRLGSR
jgi:hypothetical protein